MLLLILSSLQEDGSNLLEASLLCDRSEVGVLAAGHGFTGKCLPQILFRLGSGQRILSCCRIFLHLYEFIGTDFANGALKVLGQGTLMGITANRTLPLFYN